MDSTNNPINPTYDQDDLYYDSKIIAQIQSRKESTNVIASVSVDYNTAFGIVVGTLDRDGKTIIPMKKEPARVEHCWTCDEDYNSTQYHQCDMQ